MRDQLNLSMVTERMFQLALIKFTNDVSDQNIVSDTFLILKITFRNKFNLFWTTTVARYFFKLHLSKFKLKYNH